MMRLAARWGDAFVTARHLLVRDAGWFEPFALVTGRVPLLPVATPPNWASDHGGVFGTLFFWP
jgi:hypothetical protein